jgi:hypothetical protein
VNYSRRDPMINQHSAIILCWAAFWLMFVIFQNRDVYLTAFTATLLLILNSLDMPLTADNYVLIYYLLLFAIEFMVMVNKKQEVRNNE